jgi:hypothetical protein
MNGSEIADMVDDILFDGIWPWYLGCFSVLVVLGLVSLIPARRGHWSALVLAAPPLVIGVYVIGSLAVAILRDPGMDKLRLFFLSFSIPIFIAAVSVRFWAVQRRFRKGQPFD